MTATEATEQQQAKRDEQDDRPPRRRLQLALLLATLAAGAALLALVPALRHAVTLCLNGDFAGLRDYIRGLEAGGVLLLLALMVVHAVIFYPTELVTATAGFAYGWLPGLALCLVGWTLSALASYAIGRRVGDPLLRSVLGDHYRRFERAVHGADTVVWLSARLIPVVPFSFVGYAAGAARFSLWRFTWTSAVGFVPLTAAVSYLGSEARTLSLSNPLLWGAIALIIGLLVAGHLVARRR